MALRPEIVIVGAGPAGCTLAAMLAQRGYQLVVLDDARRPELLVGESLVPAVVPIFRRLGIEDEVAALSVHKPGASFFVSNGPHLHFCFKSVEGRLPTYAYNSPRPQLDDLIHRRAKALGATFLKIHAEVEAFEREGQPSVRLSGATKAAAEIAPDCEPFLIDATGRARAFARVMDIPATRGDRNDIAYFAHFEDFDHDEVPDGQIIISVLTHGWSWRIPLQGKLSVGVVINKTAAKALGDTPEERIENAIKTEPLLREKGQRARRVTDVMTYTNYQLISQRGYGPGWALLGDAYGFVDPMLSPGLFMGLEGARLLDACVFAKGAGVLKRPKALARGLEKYSRQVLKWHSSWRELIEYFYDGRIFRLYLAGRSVSLLYGKWNIVRWLEKHTTTQIAAMASGASTRSAYSRGMVRFMSRYMNWNVPEAANYAVKD
jgi:flavin-dependent dehydrogenase